MARIRQEDIEDVRERTDIVRLVQQYIALKKAGRAFSGLCPFHPEKTPSFSVDPAKQVYYCFGCGAGGNAFHFLEQVEGVTFPEAVERLANQAGITLRYEGVSPGERRQMSRKQSLHRANQRATDLYRTTLLEAREGESARAYLQSRGITKASVETFGIGFAPRYADFLLRRLARDLSPEILVEAGLAIKDDRGGIRDRFRARIVFPVHDLSGNAVGIGARLLEGDGPKYLNSPETPVYKKGEMLYNLNRAKNDISKSERAFLVEGYTDVIALHQAGVTTAVATCGTALGEGHFRLLSRFARRAVLAFDSDEAGARAAERAFTFHERYPIEASVLVLPEGLDPADFVTKHGGEAFEQLASEAVPLVEYMLRRAIRGHELDAPEGRARAVQQAMPIIAGLDDPVRRSEYAGMLADLAGVDTESVLFELSRRPAGAETERPARISSGEETRVARTPEPRSPDREVEKEALKLLAQHPELCLEHVSSLEPEHFTVERNRKALALLREPWSGASQLIERARDQGLAELVAEIAVEPVKGEAKPEYARRVFSRLEELSLKRRMDTMRKRLERLNPVKDPDAFDTLFKELADITSRWRDVRGQEGEGA